MLRRISRVALISHKCPQIRQNLQILQHQNQHRALHPHQSQRRPQFSNNNQYSSSSQHHRQLLGSMGIHGGMILTQGITSTALIQDFAGISPASTISGMAMVTWRNVVTGCMASLEEYLDLAHIMAGTIDRCIRIEE
jgi:hypothetical protein